ncbi:FecR family protein [Sphingobium sp. TKS]|uniref:FecR family protein n=1 Tax=Sphingobium sp. TKS TaxID=1315974 RepID=UPI000770294B|nr:FecR domain-containing protein [Sphingobium sp. TKS]AMK25322.1 anti-FecI sigma factor FecR [Sphingobium sp. TKS]
MTETIIDRAIAWHSAQDDADFDWDGFTLWLEADPAHRLAFDEIALLDDRIADHRPTLAALLPPIEVVPVAFPAMEDPVASPRRWSLWAGGGIAAAMALAVAVPTFLSLSPAPSAADYRTGAGQSRTIALKDGSRITLAASSHLRVEGEGQDKLALEGGALFDIPHRPGRTMTIRAGGQEISDIGTRFDILADTRTMRVAVAEGVIALKPAGADNAAVRLSAGRQMVIDRTTHQGEISAVAPAAIGSWRQGRLVYEGVPLSLVASDISRYAGVPVRAGADVAGRRFSGVLIVGDGSGLVGEVAQLMDLRIVREAGRQDGAVLLRAGGG